MQIPLVSGAYTSRSIIASAQRCVNLYPEVNLTQQIMGQPAPQGAPTLITHYPTPGITPILTLPTAPVRNLYYSSQGVLFAAAGDKVYRIDNDWTVSVIGTLTTFYGLVSFADNGTDLVVVDGTGYGYTYGMTSNVWATISDPAWYGANYAAYIDGFLVFNKPQTPIWYSTLNNQITPFDPLYYASKGGNPDNIVAIVQIHREIWLIGEVTSEVWYDAGASQFPFAYMQGSFMNHGCCAPRSVAIADVSVFFLSQSQYGTAIAVQGTGYAVHRISTNAIEFEWSQYSTVSDATAFTYQFGGHTFWQINFPSADKTWVYDMDTGLWHERLSYGSDFQLHRHRADCHAFAYDTHVLGDFQTGDVYRMDYNLYTETNSVDGTLPIRRIRAFPHILNELNRVTHRKFVADMQTGAITDPNATDLELSLRWSNDRGASWGNYRTVSLGATGESINLVWWRLGMCRDRVYELSWTYPGLTALNGAYVEVIPSAS